jgi:hypothetical protein
MAKRKTEAAINQYAVRTALAHYRAEYDLWRVAKGTQPAKPWDVARANEAAMSFRTGEEAERDLIDRRAEASMLAALQWFDNHAREKRKKN